MQGAVGFNYRNAPAVEAARELIAAGELGDRHARPVPALQRLRGPPGRRADLAVRARPRRQRGARRPGVARRRPGPPPARRDRFAGRRHRHLRARSGPGRPARPPGTRWRPAASSARWRTRTTCPACCGWRPARGWCWRPAGSRWASRTTTASRSTAPGARCSGTSGGWASCGVSTGDGVPGPSRSAPSTSDRATATSRRSSLAPASPMGYDDLKVIEAYRFLRSIARGSPSGDEPGRRGLQRGGAGRDGALRRDPAAGSTSPRPVQKRLPGREPIGPLTATVWAWRCRCPPTPTCSRRSRPATSAPCGSWWSGTPPGFCCVCGGVPRTRNWRLRRCRTPSSRCGATRGGYRGEGDVGAWFWGIAIRQLRPVSRGHRSRPVLQGPARAVVVLAVLFVRTGTTQHTRGVTR